MNDVGLVSYLWFYCSINYGEVNTGFMCAPGGGCYVKESRRTTAGQGKERLTVWQREERRRERRGKRRRERERGRMTSLEERLQHREAIVQTAQAKTRESMHKILPSVFLPLYSTLCAMRKIETICLRRLTDFCTVFTSDSPPLPTSCFSFFVLLKAACNRNQWAIREECHNRRRKHVEDGNRKPSRNERKRRPH